MKKITKVLVLAAALTAFGIAKSDAQGNSGTGKVTCTPSCAAASPAPSPRHVWVQGEWVPNGGAYVYKAGYWALPPRPHAIWVRGHWRNRPGGYVWVPGHWR